MNTTPDLTHQHALGPRREFQIFRIGENEQPRVVIRVEFDPEVFAFDQPMLPMLLPSWLVVGSSDA